MITLKDKVIKITRFYHRGKHQLAFHFDYDNDLNNIVRKLPGSKWSRTHNCWYIENKPTNLKLIFRAFKGNAWVDKSELYQPKEQQKKEREEKKKKPVRKIKITKETQQKLIEMKRAMQNKNYSRATIDIYVNQVALFFTWHKGDDPKSITQKDIIDFNNDFILKNGYSFSYQNQMINALKIFYKYCIEGNMEIEEIERPRKIKKLPEVLSKEEVKAVLNNCNNLKHRAALSIIYGCGLRRGELLNLKLKDIDRKRMVIWIRQSKGAKDRFVPLSKKLLKLIEDYYRAEKPKVYLFEGPSGNDKYSPTSLGKVLKNALKKAGIKKKISLHNLRHSYATHLHESGTDILHIQHLLGHRNSKTTELYTHISKKTLKEIKSPFDDL